MRTRLMFIAITAGACGAIAAPAAFASAEETAQEVISRLQSEGYTVNIDRIGTAPINDCVVTGVRNPQQVSQWVPYIGPGNNGNDRALVLQVLSQSISVSLDCSR